MSEWEAKAEIKELKHLYARATDLIGTGEADAVEEGRAIYHRIYTPDAVIGAGGIEAVTGPDAWVDVVREALAEYSVTQHLIGTQVVSLDDSGTGGQMLSYLQAWHARADGHLFHFLGTYKEVVRRNAEGRWQIAEMYLEPASTDYRQLGEPEG